MVVLIACGVAGGSLMTIRAQDKAPAASGVSQPAGGLDPVLRKATQVLERRTARFERARARAKLAARYRPLPDGASFATLEKIAACESGGDPKAVSSNGLYHGKYQFHPDTWRSVGGAGLPSRAPEVEQDYRAAVLLVKSGPGQWPVCGA
jgi:hypothetical protein